MLAKLQRPFDFLNDVKGRAVIVSLKSGKDVLADELIAFDISLNLVVKVKAETIFIKGDNVLTIKGEED